MSKQPKWYEFWKANPEPACVAKVEQSRKEEPEIREPIREIVRLMISDRKRFLIQLDGSHDLYSAAEILDMTTGEEFRIVWSFGYSINTAIGVQWATNHELVWACKTVKAHYVKLEDRAKSIQNAHERNRLMAIYNK